MSLLTSTQLESLSNEVLLEIFEYLDGYTLCSVFYRMNWRLSNLIRFCQLHIRFDKYKRDKRVWDTLATFMNPAKIYALTLYGVVIHERFLPSIAENLISLYFYRMNRGSIDRILQHLPTGNRIKTLCIHQKGGHSSLFSNFSCDYVFSEHGNRLTSLVNCSLTGSYSANDFPIITGVFSKFRRLSLSNVRWTPNFVQFLRENTPNLRSLYFHRNVSFPNELIPFVIKHIRELDMNVRGDLIDLVDILSTLPCLKRLRVLWDNNRWSAIVDGIQWQEILEKYLPCLQHFTLDFAIGIGEDIAKTFYTGEFWSKRKVVMKFVINKTQSRYRQVKTIYFGRQWHFTYFDWTEVKNLDGRRNLKLRPQSSSRSHIWSQSRSSSPPTPYRWGCLSRSLSPLQLQSRSRSPSLLHSRSRSRSESRSQSRRRLRQRSPSPSGPRSPPRGRSRSRSRRRLQRRSRSRSESRSRPRRRLRQRSPSPSGLRSPPRRRSRSRSPSESWSPSRRRLQRRSRSRPRPRLRQRSPSPSGPRFPPRRRSRSRSLSESWSRSRRRLQRRSRSRSESRSRPRRRLRQRSPSPSGPRSPPRRRSQSRSSSESWSRPRRRLQRRSRSRFRPHLRSHLRPKRRLQRRSRSRSRPRLRSPSESRSRPRRHSQRR